MCKAPLSEVWDAKEIYFNRLTELSNKHAGNPFQHLVGIQNLIAEIYNKAYESGYRQKELEVITDKPD